MSADKRAELQVEAIRAALEAQGLSLAELTRQFHQVERELRRQLAETQAAVEKLASLIAAFEASRTK